jgi:YD repeat-containing protein
MVGYGRIKLVWRLKAWVATVSVASLVLGTMVGVAAVGALVLGGPVAPAHADPPPSDPPTSISLASNETSFAVGSSATLTATTDVDVSDSASTVTITDTTTSTTLATCTTGTTCAASASFLTGPAHTYVATVNDLTSDEVTVSREAWTVGLTTSESSFAAGDTVTFTATANQDLSDTSGTFAIYIFDQSTGDELTECTSTTTCTYADSSMFVTGGDHTYVAQVFPAMGFRTFGGTTGLEATSNIVTEGRALWTVTLTTSETTISAGDSVTLTATANQDLADTGLDYYLRIYDQTTGAWLAGCDNSTTCTFTSTSLYYAGTPHTYVANVAGGSFYSDLSDVADTQATSDPLTMAETPWSLTLTTSGSTFAAGTTPTLTATANQSLAAVGGYQIYIYDETTGELQDACFAYQSTCSINVGFYSGGPHTYAAVIAPSGSWEGTVPAGVVATSDDVSETRELWTVAMTVDSSTFPVNGYSTLTATANQNLGATDGTYTVYFVDETTGTNVGYCSSPSSYTCSTTVSFTTGPAHTYEAIIAALYPTAGTPDEITDIQITSNELPVQRQPWAVSSAATAQTVVPWAPSIYELNIYAYPNQWTGYTYSAVVYDYTAGRVVGACSAPPGGACYVTDAEEVSDGPQTYVVYIAQYNAYYGTFTDVQTESNAVLTTPPAPSPAELVGASNAAETTHCGCGGDPVDTQTGEFDSAATDVSIPGAGPAVAVDRSYSSARASVDGPFGHGWSTNFSAALTTLTAGSTADPLPRAVQITQENGAVVDFYENADQTYTPPPRVLATLSYDPVSAQWKFTRRQTETMVFNSAGKLVATKDLHGGTTTLSYNGDGQVDAVSGSGGRSIALTWVDDHVTELSDSAGRTVTYGYDESGNLTSVTGVDGATWGYGYDSNHYMTTFDSPNGGATTNDYDSSGRVTAQSDAIGRETTFSYSGGTTTVTNPAGDEMVDAYSGGMLQSETVAAGTSASATTSYTYDAANNIASVTDPLGNITSYTYDSDGNTLTQTDPLGQTTSWIYDSDDDVASITDPMGRETSSTYDSAGDRLSTTTAGGEVQHWTYNADGTIATWEDARGETTNYAYNTAGLQISSTDPDGRIRSMAYNSAEIVTSTTDPAGNVSDVTSDADGRTLTTTDPNGHTTTNSYDADGNVVTVEDAADHTTTKSYDAADQLSSTTDAEGHTTTFTYTDAGLPATTTDAASHTTTNTYNARGLLTTVTDANGHVTTYGYDADGQKTSVTEPSGAESTVVYDPDGRVTSSTDALGKTTHYSYDADGELVSTTDPLGRVTTAAYNDDGELVTVTLPDSSTEHYTYNATAETTAFENADGKNATYSYDNAGLLTSKTEPGSQTTSYTYTPAGLSDVTTLPDSSTQTDS